MALSASSPSCLLDRLFFCLVPLPAIVRAESGISTPGNEGPLAMFAHLQRILCIGQAQGKEEPNGQQQRMEVPHHHGMVAQLQMIARHIALKARDALPVQLLCVSIKILPVVFVEVSGREGKRLVPEDLLQPVEALAVTPHEGYGLRLRLVPEGHRQRDLHPVLAGDLPERFDAPLVEVRHGEREKNLR